MEIGIKFLFLLLVLNEFQSNDGRKCKKKRTLKSVEKKITEVTNHLDARITTVVQDMNKRFVDLKNELNEMAFCPRGYHLSRRTHNCYRVVLKPATYSDAREKCIKDGGHITRITSKKEQDSIERHLKLNIDTLTITGFWIAGINSMNPLNRSFWHQDLNSSKMVEYFNWCEGEPKPLFVEQSSHMPARATIHNCIQLWSRCASGRYQWDNIECGMKRPYICQMNP